MEAAFASSPPTLLSYVLTCVTFISVISVQFFVRYRESSPDVLGAEVLEATPKAYINVYIFFNTHLMTFIQKKTAGQMYRGGILSDEWLDEAVGLPPTWQEVWEDGGRWRELTRRPFNPIWIRCTIEGPRLPAPTPPQVSGAYFFPAGVGYAKTLLLSLQSKNFSWISEFFRILSELGIRPRIIKGPAFKGEAGLEKRI
ncbi:hypothetical protein DFH09DRAFT_1100728 [Mycena vulgaris]|nr:hypothetical protein DFH09DRAFT_1100728 [Mycena vulgaris]